MRITRTLTWIRGPFVGRGLLEYVYFMQAGDPLAKLEIDVQSAGLNTVVSVTGPDWFLEAMDDFIVRNRL